MKEWKKILSVFLCAMLVFTMPDSSLLGVQAAQIQNMEKTQQEEKTKSNEQTQDQTKVVVDAQTQQSEVAYIYLQDSRINLPGTQKIVVGLEKEGINQPVLQLQNETTGQMLELNSDTNEEDAYLFSYHFTKKEEVGSYRVIGVDYEWNGQKMHQEFSNANAIRFGVETTVEVQADGYLVDETDVQSEDACGLSETETGIPVVTLNGSNDADGQKKLADAISQASEDVQQENATKGGDVVVMLDPGHGGSDPGAIAINGQHESDMNLAIALACRAELQTYSGIKVCMTRETDVYLNLQRRADMAKEAGASVFVAIHNNSASSAANGAMVFYPNGSYKPNVSNSGKILAEHILNNLVALGLANKGLQIRNSETNTRYPDGSLADYYAVIKHTKEYGIPGLIVEHAFVTNSSDMNRFLGTPEGLKSLGVADATGIAQYFGLVKKDIPLFAPALQEAKSTNATTVQLFWTGVTNAKVYQVYQSTEKKGKYEKVVDMEANVCNTTIKNLETNKNYYFKVRAGKIVNGEWSYSNDSNVLTVKIPAVPKIQTVYSGSETTLKVTWKKVTGAISYQLQRKEKGGKYTTVTTITNPSTVTYSDSKRKTGVNYYYRLRANYKNGAVSGRTGWSKSKVGSTLHKPTIQKTVRSDKAVSIYWKYSDEVDGYAIARSTSKNGTYKLIAQIDDSQATFYKDTSAKANKNYYYKVKAYRWGINAETSGYTTAFSENHALAKMQKVQNMEDALKVSWKKVNGITGYALYRSNEKNGTYTKIATIKQSQNSYMDQKVEAGITYYYKTRTYCKSGSIKNYSGFSTIISGKKNELMAEDADNLHSSAKLNTTKISKVQSVSSTKIKITWDECSGANGYILYRSTQKKGTYKKIKEIQDAQIKTYTDAGLTVGQTFYYKIKVYREDAEKRTYSKCSNIDSASTLKKAQITNISNPQSQAIVVNWEEIDGADGYYLYRSTDAKKGFKKIVEVSETVYTDKKLELNETYYYKVKAIQKKNGLIHSGTCSPVAAQKTGYQIEGVTSISVKQMVAFYKKSGKIYPKEVYASKGASTLQKFCEIVEDEAKQEGIRAEVLWAQICLETGYLSFPGDVKAKQCNFGGLGAVGNGAKGQNFKNVRTGVRAQVQHLKAYASTQPLKKTCVDKRFVYVVRGSAPIVEWLGIQENPKRYGWATQKNYGYNLVGIINRIKEC